jgi:hypothetical protein
MVIVPRGILATSLEANSGTVQEEITATAPSVTIETDPGAITETVQEEITATDLAGIMGTVPEGITATAPDVIIMKGP